MKCPFVGLGALAKSYLGCLSFPAGVAGAETIWFTGAGLGPIYSVVKDQARRTADREKNRRRLDIPFWGLRCKWKIP